MNDDARVIRFLFGSAVCWLVVGSLLTLLAGLELVWPGLLEGWAWFTFGRLAPAAVDALVYGWASTASLGAALWLLGRLGHTGAIAVALPIIAAAFWNIGVILGIGGILAGVGGPFFLLEFPGFAAVLLLVSFLALAGWGYVRYRLRDGEALFVSSWYLLAALLWFPWLYATANVLLVWKPVPGPAQAPIAAWSASGIVSVWLAPIALGVAYFLLSQILQRRIASYERSALAFWSFGFLAPWLGLASLSGGPIPAWLASAGLVASILILLPVGLIAASFFGTMQGASGRLRDNLPLRYVVVSAGAFVLASAENAFLALPGVGGLLHFTDVMIGQGVLVLGGFITPALVGLITYLRPEASPKVWPFWLLVGGVVEMFACFTLGGIAQGYVQSDPGFGFMTSVGIVTFFRALAGVGALAFLAAAILFTRGFFERRNVR